MTPYCNIIIAGVLTNFVEKSIKGQKNRQHDHGYNAGYGAQHKGFDGGFESVDGRLHLEQVKLTCPPQHFWKAGGLFASRGHMGHGGGIDFGMGVHVIRRLAAQNYRGHQMVRVLRNNRTAAYGSGQF